MKSLLLPLPGNEAIAAALAPRLDAVLGPLTLRHFPDGETYVRVEAPVADRDVCLVCTLHRPDDKILPLLFAAATLADLGSACVGLISPYLAYMRQDRHFREGEGITSAYFGGLLSSGVDWLVTVDPHLHRRASLAEIYSIPSESVAAAPAISEWVRVNVSQPVLIGPDVESEQWVQAVAEGAGVPYLVLRKVRRGDRDVEVSVPDLDRWRTHTPVLVDDIISTARTMLTTIEHLQRLSLPPPVCVGVHAVFADGAYEALVARGAARVVTCNTIPAETGLRLGEAVVAAHKRGNGGLRWQDVRFADRAIIVRGVASRRQRGTSAGCRSMKASLECSQRIGRPCPPVHKTTSFPGPSPIKRPSVSSRGLFGGLGGCTRSCMT